MTKILPTTIINFILDKSGSMAYCQEATISGFNEYLQSLKKKAKGSKMLFTLTLFDTLLQKRYLMTPIKEVKPLNVETYIPDGLTALYDATVETIENAASKMDEMRELGNRVNSLVIVMTDGEENSSTEHNQNCLKELIDKLKQDKRWTFVFLGANQDAWANANQMGFNEGNVVNWHNTSMGSSLAFNLLANQTMAFCSSSATGNIKSLKSLKSNFFAGTKDAGK